MHKTQKQIVIDRIKEVGYVDNFWAINNYILRLGAIIYHLVHKDGWKFEDRKFGTGKDKKNFYYYPKVQSTACCPDWQNFKDHFGRACKGN